MTNKDLPVITTGFLNCYEADELHQDLQNHPEWLENDESDDLVLMHSTELFND